MHTLNDFRQIEGSGIYSILKGQAFLFHLRHRCPFILALPLARKHWDQVRPVNRRNGLQVVKETTWASKQSIDRSYQPDNDITEASIGIWLSWSVETYLQHDVSSSL